MNLNFLSALSPLATLVLLVFLFAIAVVVALWSLLTLGSGPSGVATRRTPKRKEAEFIQPVRPNRFLRQAAQSVPEEDNSLPSELPTDHVSQSRVRILKTLEPDPELEVPQFKPTTYDQMVNRQRVPKTGLPKLGLPKAEPLNTGLPKGAREDLSMTGRGTPGHGATEASPPLHRVVTPRAPTPAQPQVPNNAPLRSEVEDTSTQPSLFETGKRRSPSPQAMSPQPMQAPHIQPPQRNPQPSVQRQESEAAFRASQGLREETPPKPKTQAEKDDAFEKFLRKNDDLSF
jgi:hypothetical protein